MTESKACCTLPAIVVDNYEIKGKYETIGDLKIYVTGDSTSTKAIFFIYDIFGFRSQTLQGADIIAKSGNYQVFMPDFFEGNPADPAWYPPVTEEQKEKLGAWFPSRAPIKGIERIPKVLKSIEEYNPAIKKWGVFGSCWGGKVVCGTSAADSPWSAAVQVHPAFLDSTAAPKVTVPMCVLASKDEPAEEVKKYNDALTVPKLVETYHDQIHGWMAARSNLADSRVKEEYERGYQTVLDFYAKYL